MMDNQYCDIVNAWMCNNYNLYIQHLEVIPNRLNTVLKVMDQQKNRFYIKLFNQPRQSISIEAEADLVNELNSIGLASAQVLKNNRGKYLTRLKLCHQFYDTLVFSEARGRECSLEKTDLKLLAQSLVQLHQYQPNSLIQPFDFHDYLKKFIKIQSFITEEETYFQYYKHLCSQIYLLMPLNESQSFCHGDARPENTFIDEKEHLAFIDFENATVATPKYDLATVVWNLISSDLSNEEIDHRLKYFLHIYNDLSQQTLQMKEILPYILFREAWSIYFLRENCLFSEKMMKTLFLASQARYLKIKELIDHK
ncbi:phosphotransferase [Acinetobacter nectaris]|nr:phosphotransferase [Acinetobacter nectaris]MCF9028267.1 phosphotransferase [Acinetobacter nectaris]